MILAFFIKSKRGAKVYAPGTVRTWKGMQYRKQASGEWHILPSEQERHERLTAKVKPPLVIAGEKEARMEATEAGKKKRTAEVAKLSEEIGYTTSKTKIRLGIKKKLGKFGVTPVPEKKLGWMLTGLDKKQVQKLQRSVATRNKFIKENQAYVQSVVNQYSKWFLPGDDMLQEGNEAFVTALNEFNTKFPVEGLQQYIRSAISRKIERKINDERRKGMGESIDDPFTMESEQGDKAVDLGETLSAEDTMKRDVEYKNLVNQIGARIKTSEARKIWFAMSAGQIMGKKGVAKKAKEGGRGKAQAYYTKLDVAKQLKMTPSTVNRIIEREIKPVAQKWASEHMHKSSSEAYVQLIQRIEIICGGK